MYSSFRECQKKLVGIAAVDYFFAAECMELINKKVSLYDSQKEILFHILIKLMNSYNLGHSCEYLSNIAGQTLFSFDEGGVYGYKLPVYSDLVSLFDSFECDGLPIYIAKEFNSLYIRKLWLYENEVAKFIKQRSQVDEPKMQKLQLVVDKLFKEDTKSLSQKTIIMNCQHHNKNICDASHLSLYQREVLKCNEISWQKIAIINSVIRKFSIISGGPGTGKTTTVAKLLLGELLLQGTFIKIALLAPTGKAARRLTESLESSIKLFKNKASCQALNISKEYYSNIALEGQTLHSFLELRPNSTYVKYNQEFPVPYDIVIVDEASMLDINIFIKLIRAISKNTKLVLIGDVNQLPSVGVGNILGSLTSDSHNVFSAKASAILRVFDKSILEETGVFDYVVKLKKNYRSEHHIVNFSIDVLAARIDFKKHQCRSLVFEKLQSLDVNLEKFANKYKVVMQSSNHREALKVFKRFRILVANKDIKIGTNQINIKIEKLLGEVPNSLYKGKPIIITQNSHSLKLYNGDIGIVWEDENGNQKAYFEHREDKIFAINMLPTFEAVYAMTIHKTQGSEFDEIAIILPGSTNRILTKELLYTGITRAKKKLTILADEGVLEAILKKKINRNSNIKELIKS